MSFWGLSWGQSMISFLSLRHKYMIFFLWHWSFHQQVQYSLFCTLTATGQIVFLVAFKSLLKSNEFILLIGESACYIYINVHFIYAVQWLGLHQASENWWGVITYILLPFLAVGILSVLSRIASNYTGKRVTHLWWNYNVRGPWRNRQFSLSMHDIEIYMYGKTKALAMTL